MKNNKVKVGQIRVWELYDDKKSIWNFETNSLDLGAQVAWMRGASEEDKAKFGRVYQEMERLPSFYEEGGGDVLTAVRDFGLSVLTDPLTYIGFGAGKLASLGAQQGIKKLVLASAKEEALKQSKKIFTKGTLKSGAAVGAVETGVGVSADMRLQEIEQEAGLVAKGEDGEVERDLTRTALVGGLTGLLGVAGGVGIGRQIAKKTATKEIAKQELAEKLAEEGTEEVGPGPAPSPCKILSPTGLPSVITAFITPFTFPI